MPDPVTTEQPAPDSDMIENVCEVMHVAYERAAIGAGWETNPLSRMINWAEVPEANKATMRAAVAAAVPVLERALRDKIADEIAAEMLAVNTRYIGSSEAASGWVDGLGAAERIARGAGRG